MGTGAVGGRLEQTGRWLRVDWEEGGVSRIRDEEGVGGVLYVSQDKMGRGVIGGLDYK